MSMNHPECQICQQADAESSINGYDVCPDCYEDIRINTVDNYEDLMDMESFDDYSSGPDYWQNDAGEWRLG